MQSVSEVPIRRGRYYKYYGAELSLHHAWPDDCNASVGGGRLGKRPLLDSPVGPTDRRSARAEALHVAGELPQISTV